MPKPSDIIATVAVLMNDAQQSEYDNTTVLPMFNLALDELQEIYELNDIPTTHQTSAAITVPVGIDRIGHDTNPALPSNLIEISQLWESQSGQNLWVPMDKKEFLPHYLQNNNLIPQFLMWSLEDDRIRVIAANQDNDLKIDGIYSIFNTPIPIGNINVNLPFINIKTFLEYKTAALCAFFIAENESRAAALDGQAGTALTRALGIPIKGMQEIVTRRRPFRANYKRRRFN